MRNQTRTNPTVGALRSIRAGKIRFRRGMRRVGEIYQELYGLLRSLPLPTKEEVERAVSTGHGLTSDLLFMGTLHAVIFLLGEAKLIADEEERYTKLKPGASFLVNNRVVKGLVNVGKLKSRLPPTNAEEGAPPATQRGT
jgi:hypothetical protein